MILDKRENTLYNTVILLKGGTGHVSETDRYTNEHVFMYDAVQRFPDRPMLHVPNVTDQQKGSEKRNAGSMHKTSIFYTHFTVWRTTD